MKRLLTILIAGALGATAGVAMASSGSLVNFKPKVMPVVVWVNAQGQVTDISPSEPLRPDVRNLLMKQIDAWIVKPAEVKGRPVASQFIIDVALTATPGKDGDYTTSFVYVDSMAMPFYGPIYWAHIDGGLEVALVSANDMAPRQEWRVRYNRVGYLADSPAARRTSHGASRTTRESRPVPTSASSPSSTSVGTRTRPAARATRVAMQPFVRAPFVPTIGTGTSQLQAGSSTSRPKFP